MIQQHMNFKISDRQIDMMYNMIDALISEGEIRALDFILNNLEPEYLPIDLSITILTVTLPIKENLFYRSLFYNFTQDYLNTFEKSEHRLYKDLLSGLE